MYNYRQRLNCLGIEIPSILLPQNSYLSKWPVIACDQFTQDHGYWEKIKTAVQGSPSSLNLIFPEAFLSDDNAVSRISDIHSAMVSYLKEGVFKEPKHGFIYIERDTPFHKRRRGLIASIDLEHYDWRKETRLLIRCTEGTVEERLPPRMDIRRNAPLEIPHVLLLIDDEKDILLSAIAELAKKNSPVYNTPLMMDCGNVAGWFMDSENDFIFIAEKIEELYNRRAFSYKNDKPFLFAAGDGNHSLAAARGIWEEYKSSCRSGEVPFHPCRYALVEIENIYDNAIKFEPIHRVILGADFEDAVSILSRLPDFSCRKINNIDELTRQNIKPSANNCFGVVSGNRYALIETSATGIAAACLQPLLDKAACTNENGKSFHIDYIHDKAELLRLTASAHNAGILLPPVLKSGLFDTVAVYGPLPRKSFSMGHSCEKRFYLECRELFIPSAC
jgi:hypothetical protein